MWRAGGFDLMKQSGQTGFQRRANVSLNLACTMMLVLFRDFEQM